MSILPNREGANASWRNSKSNVHVLTTLGSQREQCDSSPPGRSVASLARLAGTVGHITVPNKCRPPPSSVMILLTPPSPNWSRCLS